MNELTNKELVDRIELEAGGALAREVKRRLEAPVPVNVEYEAYVDRLQREAGK